MTGVLDGFAVVGAIVLVGWLLGRFRVLGDGGRDVLSRLAFFVASPALLFTLLSKASVANVFSPVLLVTVLATAISAAVFVAVGVVRHWGTAKTAVGTMCASYVNAGNLGIPIAAYVLGDATVMAPVMLFQLLLYAPAAVSVIDIAGARRTSVWQIVTTPVRNPIVIGALIGLVGALAGFRPSGPIGDALDALAGMAVPAMLLAYGISLHGMVPPGRGVDRALLFVAVPLKMVVQPVVAWLLGAFVFALAPAEVFAVVVIAALPSAQNLFTYAVRYRVGEELARDSILLTTAAAPAVLAVVAAALG